MNLEKYGLDETRRKNIEIDIKKLKYSQEEVIIGRVLTKNRGLFTVMTEDGESQNRLSGKFMHLAEGNEDYPAVGDWVLIKRDSQQIESIFPRTSAFRRQQKTTGGKKMMTQGSRLGTTQSQILASNIDYCFIVTGLDGNFNPKRIERYLVLAYDSGALPVIILSKVDLAQEVESKIEAVAEISLGVPIISTSAISGQGLEEVATYFSQGKTGVFLGSSGVGKSTITNYLMGHEVQKTSESNEKSSKGRHTTTAAMLYQTNFGGCVIDTPGLREIQLWCDEEALDDSFEGIKTLANACHFSNCTHSNEKGCAIRVALDEGALSRERYDRYLKMKREVRYLEKKKEIVTKKANKKHGKTLKRHTDKMALKQALMKD